jgi:hypothetical protein
MTSLLNDILLQTMVFLQLILSQIDDDINGRNDKLTDDVASSSGVSFRYSVTVMTSLPVNRRMTLLYIVDYGLS